MKCVRCPRESAPGLKRCRPCLDKCSAFQRKQHAARKAAGVCIRCGAKCNKYKSYCDPHGVKVRLYDRKAKGTKPRVPGGVGRPCLVPDGGT